LNMWQYATKIAQENSSDIGDVLKRKAQNQQDRNDLQSAALTYLEVGETVQAVEIMGQNGWIDKLVEVARSLNKMETKALSRCAHFFHANSRHDYTA
jgi:intraflagellar transport protein 122